jgi:hypothetical protein
MHDIRVCLVYIYISTILYISYVLLHVSIHMHHFQGVFSFYCVKVTKMLKITNSIKQYVKMFTYVTVTVGDKIQSIKRCVLSAVVITVHGNC